MQIIVDLMTLTDHLALPNKHPLAIRSCLFAGCFRGWPEAVYCECKTRNTERAFARFLAQRGPGSRAAHLDGEFWRWKHFFLMPCLFGFFHRESSQKTLSRMPLATRSPYRRALASKPQSPSIVIEASVMVVAMVTRTTVATGAKGIMRIIMEAPAQNLNTVVVDAEDAEAGKNDHFAVDEGYNFPGNLVFSKLFCLFWWCHIFFEHILKYFCWYY